MGVLIIADTIFASTAFYADVRLGVRVQGAQRRQAREQQHECPPRGTHGARLSGLNTNLFRRNLESTGQRVGGERPDGPARGEHDGRHAGGREQHARVEVEVAAVAGHGDVQRHGGHGVRRRGRARR